jgi:hypothetical protein
MFRVISLIYSQIIEIHSEKHVLENKVAPSPNPKELIKEENSFLPPPHTLLKITLTANCFEDLNVFK